MSDEAVQKVVDAIWRGELESADLTARRLCAFLGKTTGILYHHYSSLDGFLFVVSQAGVARLGERLETAFERAQDLADVAEAFIDFGLEQPTLYHLMFERHFDWVALRKAGLLDRERPGGDLWDSVHALLANAGSPDPDMDGRLLWAGLHGLVSLAASGRANVRALDRTDREVARAAARALAKRIVGEAS